MDERNSIDFYGVKDSEQKLYEESSRNRRHGIKKSSYYHRYFEGYTEIYQEIPGRRPKILRRYTASWKAQKCSDRIWIFRKLLYGILMATVVGIFLYTGTRTVRSNVVWYGGMVGGAQTVLLLICIVVYIGYAIQQRNMTIYQMKSSGGFLWKITAAGSTGFLVMMMIALFYGEYTIAVLHLFCMALLEVISVVEKRTKYIDVNNRIKMPDEATYIR